MNDLQNLRTVCLLAVFSLAAGLLVGCAGSPVKTKSLEKAPLKEQIKTQVSNIEPPREPILRIETGMHTVQMWRIGLDELGRHLVTASHDKTVRVWELPSGRLERIIRPPVGEGNEGKLYAVAISPDGRTLACGGWTKLGSDTGHTVYFFDTATGRLARRLTELPNIIFDLAFSRDGIFLAVTLYSEGLRVFRTADGAEIAADKDYGKESYGADFDIRGRLVTTCLDGYVRLYDRSFHLIAKKKAPGGELPYAVQFSPDGERIVVGFANTGKVSLLSGRDLSFLTSPDTTGVVDCALNAVSWSADGNFIYAGGRGFKDRDGHNLIRRWSRAGRGPYEDIPVGSTDTIMDLAPLPGGYLAFGAATPSFGTLSPSGQMSLFIEPAIADHRNNQAVFLVSPDGGAVQFGYEPFGKSPARFTVPARFLDTDPRTAGSLAPPRTTASGLTVTDWENRKDPKLNGRRLRI